MPTVDPNQLRARREAAGLTREQAATALAKSFKAIEAYERGANVPPGNVLVAMARLYGVAVEDLCREAARRVPGEHGPTCADRRGPAGGGPSAVGMPGRPRIHRHVVRRHTAAQTCPACGTVFRRHVERVRVQAGNSDRPPGSPAMTRGNGREPGRGSHGRAPDDITAAKRSNVVSSVTDAAGISPERELAAWAATVEHLHARGLPAPVPEFAAAWLRRRGIRPDWTIAS